MTWTAPMPAEIAPSPDGGDLRPILQRYLDHFRRSLQHICAGLTAEQLALQPVPPSSLSLLGLVRHLTKVERTWLRVRAAGEDIPPLYPHRDEDFDDIGADSAERALTALAAEQQAADAAVAALSLDHELQAHGESISLTSVYVHLVEEYARHCGHADLLRQSIDGVTGR